jgi:ribosome-associated protein
MEIKNIEKIVQQSLEDMKAQDIYQLDISKKSSITELMFIATGRSTRHVKAIADNVVLDAKRKEHAPLGVEGEQGSDWVLVDLDQVVVHVMTQHARDFYNLEKFWETEFTKKEDLTGT